MAKTIISEGKTTAEAIEKGLKIIGLPKELVEIKVIDENKKSTQLVRNNLFFCYWNHLYSSNYYCTD